MTREHWPTKLRRRPRRGAESFRSSHAVGSVGVERQVSPPPRRWGACQFLQSFEWATTGLFVRIAPRRAGGDTRRVHPAHRRACQFKGGLSATVLPPPQLARHCSRVIVADSPLKTELPDVLKGVNFGASRGKAVLIHANWSIE